MRCAAKATYDYPPLGNHVIVGAFPEGGEKPGVIQPTVLGVVALQSK